MSFLHIYRFQESDLSQGGILLDNPLLSNNKLHKKLQRLQKKKLQKQLTPETIAPASVTVNTNHGKENMKTVEERLENVSHGKLSKDVESVKSETNGTLRISNILPDINWYPQKSERSKEKFNRDLVNEYPLTYRAMTHFLQNDFTVPRLNTFQRRSLFKYPSDEEKSSILQDFPNFKSGRFNKEEKSHLLDRSKQIFIDLQFSEDDQRDFLNELESLPSCHGGARGSTSHNLVYARLYFTFHVAGKKILSYRLAFDIYSSILCVLKSYLNPMIKPASIKKEVEPGQNLNDSGNEGVRGRFKTQDSCELLQCVFAQLKSKCLSTNIDEINLKDIDWKEIQKQTFRDTRSMQKHFGLVILPLLKDGSSVEYDERTWQGELIDIIVKQRVIYIQDIDWKEIQKTHFPNNTNIQLRTFISNVIKKRLLRQDLTEPNGPIYEILAPVLDRYRFSNRAQNLDSSFVQKRTEIINLYEDLKQNSFNSVAKNSSTPNKPKASVIPVQNEPINEKRKAQGSTGSKKKRKTKHTLFTDKPGTSNLTLN